MPQTLPASTDRAAYAGCGLWSRGRGTAPVDGYRSPGRPSSTDLPDLRVMVGGSAYHRGMAPRRTAAFFDLDKTIIARSSAMAFTKPFQAGGLLSRRTVLRSAYGQFVYVTGGADHDQMDKIRAFMSTMVAGWDVATVREIVAETLHTVVDPLVYAEAVALIEEHHAAGRDVVIVSTSGSEVVGPIGAMLGADHVVATVLEEVQGRYTGQISYYAYGEEKAVAVRRLAEEHDYDLLGSYAYSDSITDVPMLATVGHPYAVNPDRDLRRVALERDWPTLVFTAPVTLRSRLPPARPTLAAIAVGGAVAAGGVLWAGSRRRRADV